MPPIAETKLYTKARLQASRCRDIDLTQRSPVALLLQPYFNFVVTLNDAFLSLLHFVTCFSPNISTAIGVFLVLNELSYSLL
jgi:hypothetical protein